ncbi:hypothetical protein V1264_014643 [Littorina saxatilis]|uniref:Uncharacterized protein n=1 Tax=Littorina saxatilis TaxID=31220 RepID=A0AAN9BQR2_9CAEN
MSCVRLFPTLSAILLPHNSQGPHETHTGGSFSLPTLCMPVKSVQKRHNHSLNHSFGNYRFGAKPHQKS